MPKIKSKDKANPDPRQRKITDFWSKPITSTLKNGQAKTDENTSADVVDLTVDDEPSTSTSASNFIEKSTNGEYLDKNFKTQRKCPSYKRVPGTSFVVDAFGYGRIPGVTANLLKQRFAIPDKFVNILSLNKTWNIQNGTMVTLYDANHCPGSVVFLFENVTGTYLHTGDMRAEHGLVEQFQKFPKLDVLYLDTTYMDPKYVFPPQSVVIEEICNFVRMEITKDPKTLVVCGTYTIGKERVLIGLSKLLDTKIGVDQKKLTISKCLNDIDLLSRLTTNLQSTNLLTYFGCPQKQDLELLLTEHVRFKHAIGVWPSGWEFRSKSGSILRVTRKSEAVTIVGAPYSEHSSYKELEHLVKTLRPKNIVPTVNASNTDQMSAIFSRWLSDQNIAKCLGIK